MQPFPFSAETSLFFSRRRSSNQKRNQRHIKLYHVFAIILTGMLGLNLAESKGQTASEPASEKEVAAEDKELKAALEKVRSAVKETNLLRAQYHFGRKDDSEDWQKKYFKAFKDGQQIKKEFFQVAYPILIGKPQLNKEMSDLAKIMMLGAYDDSQYEMSFQLADHLEKLAPSPESKVMRLRSSFLTNRFTIAQELIPQIGNLPEIPPDELENFKTISRMVELQAAEEKIRAAELLADDLPRVELDTSEGKIVLELFEDQYPDTVGHFISLVENDFYRQMLFHKVIKNFLPFSMAQTGLLAFVQNPENGQMGWRPKMIDYRIPTEAPVDGNHRPHFRGSVSFLIANDQSGKPIPDSAGALFFIELTPLMALESTHVPFGRVISDMTIVDRLNENFTISKKDFKESPMLDSMMSLLNSAKVIRKRNHIYEPRKIK